WGLKPKGVIAASISGMGLVYGVAAPAIERVVEGHGGLELGEIVPIHPRVPERCRQQAGRLRRQLELPGIGATHDDGETRKRIRTEREFLDHHVEGAPVAAVVPECTPDIEGCCLELFGHGRHLGWRHEEEDSLSIDKAADQPRAGDAHDLWSCPRYPDSAA